ncbi:response regulator transcription factor [Vibrio sp. SCSIO 43137]|uniref:response regulator transcription factor n=1 Tax=Vibrio sp. SCSIO 43137 TaxID=3021011 RepID=UPI0023077C83|nr:LuxR C-terminal-related transcriptional regulator [Vibrio sp. SCSIO 43137]WCE29994.1 LuxR C-terminal-related transcriptional regulator [Vibrio sp. SCSIO 43137]
MTTAELLSYGNLRGIFPSNIAEQALSKALFKLAHEHYSLPEDISEQLLQHYQSCIVRFGDPTICNLTFREKELLRHLRQGMSNNQLADKLFISEHTVKSHLYKIFKKIKVKNRNSAVAWAYKYLS